MKTDRLVVVSNRVAPPADGARPWTAGGLVAALQPAVESMGRVMWFGWSGVEGDPDAPVHREEAGGVEYATINLSAEDVRAYYEGFCNQLLWPLLHGLSERASLDAARHFGRYREVNARFARELATLLEPGDLVWVQDYHLIPLATMLREEGWDGRVGYFHHVPIPDPTGWRYIPHSARLARDFEAYDRIGVQTRRDARHLRAVLGPAGERVGAYPISIDPGRFRSMLVDEPVPEPLGPPDERLIYFGVDRLDYTKGIPQRLDAFERAIAADEALLQGARFVQWAAPSRANIPEYQQEREIIDATARRIRRQHPAASVQVDFESRPPPAVAAAMRQADVCVVTSVADGMNLVAKEYAAMHSEKHPGVLILSDTCGASEELSDALVFPGGNVGALAAAMRTAFEMPLAERRERSRRLRAAVDGHTSTDWLRSFIDDLAADAARPSRREERKVPRSMPVLRDRVERRLREFERDDTVRRIWRRDHTVWKPRPEEISDRLGWLDVDATMAERVDDLRTFAAQVERDGYRHVLLLGMGGSSLAPQVFASTFAGQVHGLDLVVLDSTVPSAVRSASVRAPSGHTLIIVSSKSGGTLETRALLDYFWAREPDGRHFVAITDEGSELDALARERGFRRVFLNPADVGGRYSALTYVGLVPAALLGVDLGRLLAGARQAREASGAEVPVSSNAAARLGVTIGEAALMGHDCLTMHADANLERFGAWLEQLIAESTGKEDSGILPVLGEPLGHPDVYRASRLFMSLDGLQAEGWRSLAEGGLPTVSYPCGDAYALGGDFWRWEFAVAVAGRVLGINPFDQPDVEATKRATEHVLAAGGAGVDGPSAAEALARVTPEQYVAVHAYLPRTAEHETRLQRVRVALRDRLRIPTTVEYGPSLLHSTGQYHKGGHRRGVFVQVLDQDADPLPIPGRDYTFEELKDAQAAGDRAALAERGRVAAHSSLKELEALA